LLHYLSPSPPSKIPSNDESNLFFQFYFPFSTSIQILNSIQQNLFTPVIIENNCLLVSLGDAAIELLPSHTASTSKLFYEHLVNVSGDEKLDLYDIRFMAYECDFKNGSTEK
jgi:hypothetical protein